MTTVDPIQHNRVMPIALFCVITVFLYVINLRLNISTSMQVLIDVVVLSFLGLFMLEEFGLLHRHQKH